MHFSSLIVAVLLSLISLVLAQVQYRGYYYPYYRNYPSYRDYYYNYYRNYYDRTNVPAGDPLFHHIGHNTRRSSHLDRYGGNHH